MNQKRHLLFSYGTLQQDNVQMATYGRYLNGHLDSLSGYRLDKIKIEDKAVILTSGKNYHPIAVKTELANDCIEGTIFELSETELQQTDHYEVDEYQRVLETFASFKQAWVYVNKM